MELMDKLKILTDSAKYDTAGPPAAATEARKPVCWAPPAPRAFVTAFQRTAGAISLLKVLMTNCCIYDCQYCVNRCSNDVPRATFTTGRAGGSDHRLLSPELYRGPVSQLRRHRQPDTAMERMCKTLELLRGKYRFNGYIHAKAIPGCSPELVEKLELCATE